MANAKYKRMTDLFVRGKEVPFDDQTVIWVQTLNPFERDEAVHDAQVARSRFVMAMREDGSERVKIEAKLLEEGREKFMDDLAGLRADDKFADILNGLRDDPEWTEKIEILERSDPEQEAKPLSDTETTFLTKLQTDYLEEIFRRQADEVKYQKRRLRTMNEHDLLEDYLDLWLERRGGTQAQGEYLLTELWYGSRVCEGKKDEDGVWDHSQCDHSQRIWDTKAEVRSLPEDLQVMLRDALTSISMTVREAKNSARQGSSSDSSPLPSEAEESTPSTPVETQGSAHGS